MKMAPPARSAAQAGDEKGGQDSAQTLRQETEQAHKLLRDAKTLRRASLISIDSENEHKLVEVRTGCCGMDPTTGRGKQLHLIQMLLLPFIPIMALITQNVVNMLTVLEHQYDMQESIDQVQISTDLGNVTEALQSERAEIAFFLFTNGSVIRRNLSEHFQYTNLLIDDLQWPDFRIDDELFQNKILFRIRLDDFRNKIAKFDFDEKYSIESGIEFYNKANYIFLDQLTREIKEKDASGVWRLLLAYKNMIRAIEHLGISMVFGEQYYGRGELDQSSYIEFVTNDALGQDFLNQSQNFAYWIKDRDRVEKLIMNEMRDSNSQVFLGIAVLCTVLLISPIIILLVRMVTRTLQAST
ncbi:hypothetical protein FJT64_022714 [Amphibalanus amphitrite]|uniref:Nitrate/nitrite sensing protein domain-containing protein n=1 Tax=Amphibalanus amphitrite TaxID=1232801 RepID=A0A6A4WSS6_AMPAM|nr:hypothetical protein FJT64_022714 [Amphibalanus amphitrite]